MKKGYFFFLRVKFKTFDLRHFLSLESLESLAAVLGYYGKPDSEEIIK